MAYATQDEAGAGMQQSKQLPRQPGRLPCCHMRIWSQAQEKTMDPSALEVGKQLQTLPMQPVLSPWPCEGCVPPKLLYHS